MDEAGVADLFLRDGLDCGGDDACGGEGAAGAELRSGEGLDGGADGDVAERGRGGIDSGVGPAGFGGDFFADGFCYGCVFGECGGEVGDGGFDVALVFGEDTEDDVGAFEADGELFARADVVGAGEEG